MNQKQKILLGLLVTLAIALAYRLTNPFEQETVDRLTYVRATKVASAKAADTSPHQTQVRLDLFQSPPQSNVTIQRDLFRPPNAAKPSNDDNIKPEAPAPKPRPKSDREKIQEHFQRFKAFGSYQHGKKIYLFLKGVNRSWWSAVGTALTVNTKSPTLLKKQPPYRRKTCRRP